MPKKKTEYRITLPDGSIKNYASTRDNYEYAVVRLGDNWDDKKVKWRLMSTNSTKPLAEKSRALWVRLGEPLKIVKMTKHKA